MPASPFADRWLAAGLAVIGLAIGLGGADEFRYFGPGTPQFWAGAAAAPAGVVVVAAAVRLWREGAAARPWVLVAAVALLLATVVGAALRVMGPPPIVLGALGATAAGLWVWRHRAGA